VYLSPVLGKYQLDQIGATAILKLKTTLAGLAASSTNQVLLVLSSVLTTARKLGLIAAQPKLELVKVPTTRKIKHLEPDDFEKLVEAASQVTPTCLAVVLLAGDAGLRLGEVIALRPKDLDFRARVVHVNTTVWHGHRTLPKGGEPRTLPMSNRLVAALQSLDLRRPDMITRDSTHGHGQCTPDAIANLIRRAARIAALGHVHAHMLRHTFATRLISRGVDARTVQQLMGHHDIKTTLSYVHLIRDAERRAIDALDPATGIHLVPHLITEPRSVTTRGQALTRVNGDWRPRPD
jgi:integrase